MAGPTGDGEMERLSEQSLRLDQHHRGHEQAGYGMDPKPGDLQRDGAGNDDAQRNGSVGPIASPLVDRRPRTVVTVV